MAWSRITFEGGGHSPQAESFRASMLQVLYELPDEEAEHIGVYMRSTLMRETEFILSPGATAVVGHSMPEYELLACGRPPSGLFAVFGTSFAADPAWFDLPAEERSRHLEPGRLTAEEADLRHRDLLMDLGFIKDDRGPVGA